MSDWSSDVCSSDLSSFGAAKTIVLYGNDTQKARWLPGLASGETIGAITFAAGPDPLPAHPAVTLNAGKAVGTAVGVSGGLFADVAILFADEDGSPALAIADLADIQRMTIDSFDNSRCIEIGRAHV